MKLIGCYIENFGLLHAAKFTFSKGLNCCISDNGTGKTTLAAFIEAMLYGIGDSRRQSLDENPRKKYMPWQGGKFGGSLTIEVGKKRYTVERSFGQRPADDTFRLIETDNGKISTDYSENIGEELFGIDRDGFLRTVFLSEKNLQGKNDNKSISAKLSDLVGVDGDVGGFDDALKLLEERRKFYFKKGNAGEIANVKERINECQRKIDAIFELEKEASQKEAYLKELRQEKERLLKLEEAEKTKLESIKRQREKNAYEERYVAMLDSLSKERARFDEVKQFFSGGLPTAEAIDSARDAYVEADRLKKEALAEKGNEEYVELGEFFKGGTNFAEIADVERAAEIAEERAREVAAIDNESDEISVKMRKIFKGSVPKKDEIEKAEHIAAAKPKIGKIIGFILGVALFAGGFIIGNLYGYITSALGAIVSIVSILVGKNKDKSKELLSFVRKYSDDDSDNATATLEKIKKDLAAYEELAAQRAQRRDIAYEEYSSLTMKVFEFLGKFPTVNADTALGSVRNMKRKYTQYYALGQAGEAEASGKLEKLKKSEALSNAVRDFLKNYPTVTNSPFTEIRDRLSDYNYLKLSIAKLERECDVFAVKYNVTGKSAASDAETEASITATLTDLGERLKALAAQYALAEREMNITEAEIEKKDEYEMAKSELEELYKKHVDSLDIIKKTSLCLKEACDNITSKYLGKTKEKFKEYSSVIAGVDGDYTLNTSFELSKTERGESHGIESYSRGTRDLYALGLRLALVDALYENESPFIILDDPFIALDDVKLERAKSMLKTIGKTKQILYFTCAKSREIV